MPNGFTQNSSGNSGSRAVMWPATPSEKPNLPKMRNAPASLALRWARSSSTVAKVGGRSSVTSWGTSGRPSMVRAPAWLLETGVSVIAMPRRLLTPTRS